MRIIICFIILVWLSPYDAHLICQSNQYRIDHIGYAEGLSGQLVRSIKEDDFGHLWIATYTELNKYDGFQTKIFDNNKTALSNNTFIDLLKDSRGNIWTVQVDFDNVGVKRYRNSEFWLYSYEISIINPGNDSIYTFKDYLNDPDLKLEDISGVYQRGNAIYIIDKLGNIFVYDESLSQLCKYDINSQFVGITNQNSYCIIDEANIIQEFDFDNRITFSYDKINIGPSDIVSIGTNGHILYLDSDEDYYSGLYLLSNGKSKKLPNYKRNSNNLQPKQDTITRNLNATYFALDSHFSLVDNQAYLSDSGMELYTELESIFRSVSDIEYSKSSNYYVATNIGVTVLKKKENYFKQIQRGQNQSNSVRGMLKYDDIFITKSEDNKAIASSPDGSYDVSFFSNKMSFARGYHRDEENKDYVWLCGRVSGNVQLLDLAKQEIIYPEIAPEGLLNNFYRSQASNMLYVYGKSGLFAQTGSANSWTKVDLEVNGATVSSINHINEHDNKLYLATDEGLVVYEEHYKKALLIPIINNGSNCKLSFISIDKVYKNILWLGTKHKGAIKYDIVNNQKWNLNSEIGLSNNNIHAILEDDLNRLWIPTNKYLNCFDKSDSTIYVFTTDEGLTHEEFNQYSYYNDQTTGEFYFGGLDGYNCFNPNEIELGNNNLQSLNIDYVKTISSSGKEHSFSTSEIGSNILNINDNEAVINLTFTLSDVYKTSSRKFYYRIKELNENWSKLVGNNLSIARLPYGEYTLELVADKHSPVSRTSIKSVTLKFVKPFYKSVYFISALLLLLFLLSYLWLSNRDARMIRRNSRLEKLVNERTKELQIANDTKNKILAILSHDLKSPMGGLRNYYEKLEFLLKKDRLEEIQELSKISKSKIQNLENTLDNLLLWALAESQSLSSKAELLSLHYEVNDAIQLSDHIIDKNELEILNQLEVLDQVMVDKNILQTILRNILHNAIKFSYKNGTIIISKVMEDQEYISVTIRDFGIGMELTNFSTEQAQLMTSNQGLGFGLSTSRDLAKVANIGITIDSEVIQGTRVTLKLPKRVTEKAER